MPEQPAAVFAAEVGTVTTRLTLVELVEQEFRLVARAETPSSLRGPHADVSVAILELAATIAEITGREFVRDGKLIRGADTYGNGVDTLVVTTSAAGAMSVVIAALTHEQSARAAINAARGAYATIEDVFALDEAGSGDAQWLGAQIIRLAGTTPEVMLVAGGLEGGAAALDQIAHVVALLARRGGTPRIIYAGNTAAGARFQAALGQELAPQIVENVRPAAAANRLQPLRALLRSIYNEQRLPALPGYESLRAMQPAYIGTAVDDQALMVRYLAERFERNILALDAGATHSAGIMQAEGHFSQAILADTGLGAGAIELLQHAGVAAIGRWLPFPIEEHELRDRLLNRLLHSITLPVDLDDLLLDQALLREALRQVLEALRAARPSMRYDLVIAGGALAHAPRPGLAALVLLDTLPLDDDASHFAVDLYLDSLSLLAAGGALAQIDADAAACLMERDGLTNGPLATVVIPHGKLEDGRPALTVELEPSRGEAQRVEILGGQIARLALRRGERGTLRILPAADVYIGGNPVGAEVVSDEAAIGGSALGVLLDARPRPLRMAEDLEERRRRMLGWLTALDALPAPVEGASVPPWQHQAAPEASNSTPPEESPAPPAQESGSIESANKVGGGGDEG